MADSQYIDGEDLEDFEGCAWQDAEGQQPGEVPAVLWQGGDNRFVARTQSGERDVPHPLPYFLG